MIKYRNLNACTMAIVSLGLMAAHSVKADLISYVGTETQANGTVAPGQQYDFFAATGNPVSLTSFSVNPNANSAYNSGGVNNSYSTLIAPGTITPFQTGIIYDTTTSGQPYNILSFQITDPSVSSFDVWVLNGNTDGNGVGNNSITLSDGGSQSVTESVLPDGGYANGINQFTEFSISGATTGDIFSLNVTPYDSGIYPSLGGITFAAVAAPEPSSVIGGALVIVVLGFSSLRLRRKQKSA